MAKKAFFLILAVMTMIIVLPASAGTQVLSDNSGDGNAPFFISGEPSLVINGFDLNSLGIQRPAVIDKVSISVKTPVPGTAVDVVIYQDANGGSPVDASLAGTMQVTIDQAGVFTATFPTPVTVTQPVIWVGFYLPVNFNFFADTSGTSVLTYWAWTTGGRFNLNSLSSASVLGPAVGTAPVNIDLKGKARITAEITGANGGTTTTTTTTTTSGQSDVNLGVMQPYANCGDVSHDTADEYISYQDQINLSCQQVALWQSPAALAGYTLRGNLYDILAFKANGVVEQRFLYRITHCIRPAAEDLDHAVIGSAYGSPRQWHILTTERFGDVVCAEVRYIGNLAYFIH